ncbi:hypothetical protein [Tepidibacter aestuarii]|uniref:hypothetical protein n=1 Tax=Tepidibacter aestuarii TaxID=2925782 RepID=UPI0020BFC0F5|nr:hypothetical protein [Tepidibacter aestuarii]CAH2213785.1 conserved membrane protein of unknown function [Tepidibacter aestuarii]
MLKFIKKVKRIIIFTIAFIAIELYFLFKSQPNDLELFFMVWGGIYLALLLFNIFNVKSDLGLIGIGGDDQTIYANLSGSMTEIEYGTKKNKQRTGGELLDYMNLVYIILILINSIGYIIVMPK